MFDLFIARVQSFHTATDRQNSSTRSTQKTAQNKAPKLRVFAKFA